MPRQPHHRDEYDVFATCWMSETWHGDPLPVCDSEHEQLADAVAAAREIAAIRGESWVERWTGRHSNGGKSQIVQRFTAERPSVREMVKRRVRELVG